MGMEPEVRIAEEKDAGQFLEIYGPICRDTTISFEYEAPGLDEMKSRIAGCLGEFPWIVLEQDKLVLGYAYAGRHRSRTAYRWSTEVSIYVRDSQRRGGLGRCLYTTLFEILCMQGFFNAYAGVTLPNDPSVGFHKALGFDYVGTYENVGFKHGAWRDVSWWRKILAVHKQEPEAPLEFASIRTYPELKALLGKASGSL